MEQDRNVLKIKFINYLTFVNITDIDLIGGEADWDFRISDLVKNPDGTNI